jgi:ABC-type glutathione transport system ATPase component
MHRVFQMALAPTCSVRRATRQVPCRPSAPRQGPRGRAFTAAASLSSTVTKSSQSSLIVADEPTGDLDRSTGAEVLALLQRLVADEGKTIVMVTHDPKAAASAGRLVHLEKGVLVDELPVG